MSLPGAYKSLPFATYDLAVYLPGGAVLVVLAQYALETTIGTPFRPSDVHFGGGVVDNVVLAVLWLSASYLAGHLGAYLSALVIEKFVHNALSYPSTVWLKREEYTAAGISGKKYVANLFQDNARNYKWNSESIVAFAFLFPFWPLFLVFLMVKPVGFYDSKLPEGLLSDVRREFRRVSTTVSVDEGTRWEKLVEHFVANNCPAAYVRMYNYLVIYGALRLLSFIMALAGWIILIKSAIVFLSPAEWSFSGRRIALYIGVSVAGYMAMLAFAKFNRRFFEECILALLLAGKSHAVESTRRPNFRTRS